MKPTEYTSGVHEMNIRQINGFLIHLPIGMKIIVVVSFDPVDSPYFGKP